MPTRPIAVRRLIMLALGATIVTAAGCIQIFYKKQVRSLPLPSRSQPGSTIIQSPLKVHLIDGSTVIYRKGAVVSGTVIVGSGEYYALLQDSHKERTDDLPMDSIIGIESFESKTLVATGVITSIAATAGSIIGVTGLLVAIFGSCPTIYADTGTGPILEAEGFSYAIAPLLERRDVDALRARPDARGVVRLELRNEALETHFINQVELLRVNHASAARVVPDQASRPIAVSGFVPIRRAFDRSGHDVRAVLAERDGQLFASSAEVIRSAKIGDLDDWIDIDVADLPPGDSIAVVLRLRNSLLNTVLLYDGMLGGRDAADWLNNELQNIASAVDLSRWYGRTMGMRATVEGVPPEYGDTALGVARFGDVGPIAFRDVALLLPRAAHNAKSAHIRLRFVADNWRIDQAQVAGIATRPPVELLPVDSVIVPTPASGRGPTVDVAAVAAISAADDKYLETQPGQRMTLVFHAPRGKSSNADSTTTYLIAWQGWYREWIRANWLTNPTRTTPFIPGDAAVLTALRSWSAQKTEFEKQFYSTKIPVR